MSHHFSLSVIDAQQWRRWKAIRLAALAEAPYAFGSTYEEALTFTNEDWQSHFNRGPYLIAQQEQSDVGVVRLAPGDEPHVWWLYSLWVAPVARGTGLVEQLLAMAEEIARRNGAAELRLDVARGNVRALAAYRRNGYAALSSSEGSEDHEEIVMQKDLYATSST